MAITPKQTFVSPTKHLDDTSTYYTHEITNLGDPDGAADPQASAAKGTLYRRTNADDDKPSLSVKIDDDGADDDWKKLIHEDTAEAFGLAANVTMETSNGILLRDSGQKIYSPSANTGAIALAASGDVWQTGDQGGSNYVQCNYRGEHVLEGTARFEPMGAFSIWDDFLYQTIAETDTPWILNSGIDAQAIDPAIYAQEYGVLRCRTGDDDGATANDASQFVCHIPVQADSLGLVMETRLRINTAITNVAVNIGFTDITTLEEPFTIAGGDAVTSNATDAACFTYDTDADTDEWFALAVDSDTDDSGNSTTGTAPTADVYQVFRIEIDSDGNTIRYYIDGTLEATLTGGGISPDVDLYATVIACGDSVASKTVDVDYMWIAHNR